MREHPERFSLPLIRDERASAARTFFVGGRYQAESLPDLNAEVARFHAMLEDLARHVAAGTELNGTTEERLLQGPLADAMTHASPR